MKKKKEKSNSFPSTWRDLKPNSPKRPASKTALRKRFVAVSKSMGVFAVICLFGVGAWWINDQRIKEEPLNFFGPEIPVENIIFETDGVLADSWYKNWYGPLRGRSLMDIDINSLQKELQNESQIEGAQVARLFPNTLKIEINEHQPILVLRLRKQEGGFQDWMVAVDGTLYKGTGYSQGTLNMLPSLSIDPQFLRPHKSGNGFEKLEDISAVAPLLELAQRKYPGIYRDWKVVSYNSPRENDPGSHILIRSKKIRSLRFSPKNFSAQMKRLKYLLLEPEYMRRQTIESIDLSHDRSVFAKL